MEIATFILTTDTVSQNVMTAKLHCEQGRRHSLPVDAVCGLWRRLIAYGYRLTPLTPSSHMRHKKTLYHESLLGNEKKTGNN